MIIPPPPAGGFVAISLWQPWASLIAEGFKTAETRGWATRHRGPLAIHAARTRSGFAALADPAFAALCRLAFPDGVAALPLGAVVAVAELCDVIPAAACRDSDLGRPGDGRPVPWVRDGDDALLDPLERVVGDLSPGRWAWLLGDVVPFDPVPASGGRSLWRWHP